MGARVGARTRDVARRTRGSLRSQPLPTTLIHRCTALWTTWPAPGWRYRAASACSSRTAARATGVRAKRGRGVWGKRHNQRGPCLATPLPYFYPLYSLAPASTAAAAAAAAVLRSAFGRVGLDDGRDLLGLVCKATGPAQWGEDEGDDYSATLWFTGNGGQEAGAGSPARAHAHSAHCPCPCLPPPTPTGPHPPPLPSKATFWWLFCARVPPPSVRRLCGVRGAGWGAGGGRRGLGGQGLRSVPHNASSAPLNPTPLP